MSKKRGRKESLNLTKEEWFVVADALDFCAEKSLYDDSYKRQLRSIIERIELYYGDQ